MRERRGNFPDWFQFFLDSFKKKVSGLRLCLFLYLYGKDERERDGLFFKIYI